MRKFKLFMMLFIIMSSFIYIKNERVYAESSQGDETVTDTVYTEWTEDMMEMFYDDQTSNREWYQVVVIGFCPPIVVTLTEPSTR